MLMTHLILVLTLAFDLTTIQSEPNLEKRSERALDNANLALDAARDDYNSGNFDKSQNELQEVRDSVELAYQSLSDTGKDPRKDPKFFKRAELRTRELLRRLEGVGQGMSQVDRGTLDKVRERISEVHDNLLNGIMSKKKK
jgi:exonuclease VII small subunit